MQKKCVFCFISIMHDAFKIDLQFRNQEGEYHGGDIRVYENEVKNAMLNEKRTAGQDEVARQTQTRFKSKS